MFFLSQAIIFTHYQQAGGQAMTHQVFRHETCMCVWVSVCVCVCVGVCVCVCVCGWVCVWGGVCVCAWSMREQAECLLLGMKWSSSVSAPKHNFPSDQLITIAPDAK